MLLIAESHPVQYHAPVYRAAAAKGLPLHVVYGSDFSVAGHLDREFGAKVAWDSELLTGYSHEFLSTVATGGAKQYENVSSRGFSALLRKIQPSAVLTLGYAARFDRQVIRECQRAQIPMMLAVRALTCIVPQHARARKFQDSIAPKRLEVVWNCPTLDEVVPQKTKSSELQMWFHGSVVPGQLPRCVLSPMESSEKLISLRGSPAMKRSVLQGTLLS
ncbi:MAG: hypothetical protein ABGZ35_22230 [Planctomycetaceae bacterium]